MPSTISINIGSRIRACREQKGITQMHLARTVGLTAPQLERYEAGYGQLSAERLLRIAQAMSIHVGDLTSQAFSGAFVSEDINMANHHYQRSLLNSFSQIASPDIQLFVVELIQGIANNARANVYRRKLIGGNDHEAPHIH